VQEAGEILVCLLDELESLGAIQVQLSTLVSVFDRPKLAAPDEVGSHKALGVSCSPSASPRRGPLRVGNSCRAVRQAAKSAGKLRVVEYVVLKPSHRHR